MQIVCRPKLLEQVKDNTEKIICEIVAYSNPNGDPVPSTISIRGTTEDSTQHLFRFLDYGMLIIDLERPPVYLPESTEGVNFKYKDKYEEWYDGKRMVFRRSTGHPNPLFYNAFYGQLDIGYLAVDIYKPTEWFYVLSIINHERVACDSFQTARQAMCQRVFDLIKDSGGGNERPEQ